jgi:uncharacterized membrane protein
MLYGIFLFLHLLGIALWLGGSLTIAAVTGRAVRSGDRNLIAFAYRTAVRVNRSLGFAGMLLTVGGGVALMVQRGHPWFQPFPDHWLFQMQLLGFLAFAVGVFYLIPIRYRLAEAAEASAAAGEDSATFIRFRRRHAVVGSLVSLVLLVVLALGALKI